MSVALKVEPDLFLLSYCVTCEHGKKLTVLDSELISKKHGAWKVKQAARIFCLKYYPNLRPNPVEYVEFNEVTYFATYEV